MHLSTVDIDATFDLLMFQCDALKFLGIFDFEKFELVYSSMRWNLIVVIIYAGLRYTMGTWHKEAAGKCSNRRAT